MTTPETPSRSDWQPGERAELARLAGVSPQLVCDILHCRCRAAPSTALRLELAAHTMGLPLRRDDFVWPEQSDSPLISRPRRGT